MVQQTLQAVQAENVEMLRSLEVDRLDALQHGLWDEAIRGNVSAAMAAQFGPLGRLREVTMSTAFH